MLVLTASNVTAQGQVIPLPPGTELCLWENGGINCPQQQGQDGWVLTSLTNANYVQDLGNGWIFVSIPDFGNQQFAVIGSPPNTDNGNGGNNNGGIPEVSKITIMEFFGVQGVPTKQIIVISLMVFAIWFGKIKGHVVDFYARSSGDAKTSFWAAPRNRAIRQSITIASAITIGAIVLRIMAVMNLSGGWFNIAKIVIIAVCAIMTAWAISQLRTVMSDMYGRAQGPYWLSSVVEAHDEKGKRKDGSIDSTPKHWDDLGVANQDAAKVLGWSKTITKRVLLGMREVKMPLFINAQPEVSSTGVREYPNGGVYDGLVYAYGMGKGAEPSPLRNFLSTLLVSIQFAAGTLFVPDWWDLLWIPIVVLAFWTWTIDDPEVDWRRAIVPLLLIDAALVLIIPILGIGVFIQDGFKMLTNKSYLQQSGYDWIYLKLNILLGLSQFAVFAIEVLSITKYFVPILTWIMNFWRAAEAFVNAF